MDKPTETGERAMSVGVWGVIANGRGLSLGGEEHVLKLDCGDGYVSR